MSQQLATQYFAESTVHDLLDAGIEPLREAAGGGAKGIGAPCIAMGLETRCDPAHRDRADGELERALQTPTFEMLQQKADQAMFERRALAVEKERAIAENELANKTELARRESQLIAQEAGQRAQPRGRHARRAADRGRRRSGPHPHGRAGADGDGAGAHRRSTATCRRTYCWAWRRASSASKLTKIEHLNVTPDLLATVLGEFGKGGAMPQRKS